MSTEQEFLHGKYRQRTTGKLGRPRTRHQVLAAETSPAISGLLAGFGLHSVLALTISAPLSSRSKCRHSTSAEFSRSSTLLPEREVRDCSTLSLPHSLRYSKVMAESSRDSKMGGGALCNWHHEPVGRWNK